MKSSNLKLLRLVGPGLMAVLGDAGASKGHRRQRAAARWSDWPQPWELGQLGWVLLAGVWPLRLPGEPDWYGMVVPQAGWWPGHWIQPFHQPVVSCP